jgi:hypothetical protein
MSELIKVLFLAANPTDQDLLKLDEEICAIEQTLRQTDLGDRFKITKYSGVSVSELQKFLLKHKPDIIHFSGHGSGGEIILEDKTGKSQPVSPHALSELFSILGDDIRCVVLNACDSEQQAQAIAEHVDCVVGMSKEISDPSAIKFATAFYQALGYGKDVMTAFDLGRNQIDLENLNEQDTPKLIIKRKVDPRLQQVAEEFFQGYTEAANRIAQRYKYELENRPPTFMRRENREWVIGRTRFLKHEDGRSHWRSRVIVKAIGYVPKPQPHNTIPYTTTPPLEGFTIQIPGQSFFLVTWSARVVGGIQLADPEIEEVTSEGTSWDMSSVS